MKPRGKRNSKSNRETYLEVSEVTGGETSPKKKTVSNLPAGEGVQCEMGSEVLRRYWTPSSEDMARQEANEVVTGEPSVEDSLTHIAVQQGTDSVAASTVNNPVIEGGDKVDRRLSSNWSNVFPSHEIILEKGPDADTAPCEEHTSLVLKNNGADADTGTMVFPLVLNVVDGSVTKEVVAVVSLDPMPSSTLPEHENVLSESSDGNVLSLNQSFTCGDCGQIFNSIVPFEKHCLEHNSSDPFKCTRCSRRFKRRQDLDRHRVSHPEEAFSCTTCFAKFSDQEELTLHYKSHATAPLSPKPSEDPDAIEMLCKIETFQCSQCDRSFNDADLLQHHEFTHSEGALYPCDQCGRTFREESRLVMHLKLHKKNQRCDKCNEIFTNIFDFNEHMIAHKYEDSKEDYKCLHCKVSFNSFQFLKKHVSSSHGMEVHWCGDCGGSGHVGLSGLSLGHMKVSDPDLIPEKQMLLIAKTESLLKQGQDPLKLEDSGSNDASARLEQDQPEDVTIQHEGNSFSDDETDFSQLIRFREKTVKRKVSGHAREARHEVSVEPQAKSARND